jgi:hypothetical protein
VRNLATEAYSGGGQTGAEINRNFPTPAGMPPLGFVVNAWMIKYPGEAARFARALIGEHDWRHPETIVYPRLALTLFLADAASGKNAPPASVVPQTGRPIPVPTATRSHSVDPSSVPVPTQPFPTQPSPSQRPTETASPTPAEPTPGEPTPVAMSVAYAERAIGCDSVIEFVDDGIKKIAGLLKVDASGSGAFVRFLAFIWNTVVDLAAFVVKALIERISAPVVAAIGGVLTAVGAAYQIASLVKEWVVKLEPVPAANAFGIGAPNSGRFKLTVTDDRFQLPSELESCSKAAGLDLAKAGAPGSKVTWTAVPSGRPDLAVQTSADATIGDDRTATFSYNTGVETAEQAKGSEVSGAYEVRASIRREKIDQLRTFIADALLRPLAGLELPDFVKDFLRRYAANAIGLATDRLASFTDVKAYGMAHISYHEPTQSRPQPTVPTEPTTNPPGAGDLCDLVDTGTYTGTLTWTSDDTVNGTTTRTKGTGPVTFTVAADGTVSGSFKYAWEGDRADDTYGPLGNIEGGTVTGSGCRPRLDTTGAKQIYLPSGPTQTIPFNWFGTGAPQPSIVTVHGRTITAAANVTTRHDNGGIRTASTTVTASRG